MGCIYFLLNEKIKQNFISPKNSFNNKPLSMHHRLISLGKL